MDGALEEPGVDGDVCFGGEGPGAEAGAVEDGGRDEEVCGLPSGFCEEAGEGASAGAGGPYMAAMPAARSACSMALRR